MNNLTKQELLTIMSRLNIKGQDTGTSFKFNCLWHNDSNPSMSLLYDTNIAKCFSCGHVEHIAGIIKLVAGQSVYKFLGIDYTGHHTENLGFLRSLDSKKKPIDLSNKKVHNVNGTFLKIIEGTPAYEYLVNTRNISEAFIKEFDLTFTKFAEINRNEEAELEQDKKGTYFIRRVCTPIYLNNELVNIDGRAIDDTNTPKVLYPKNGLKPLFNFDNLDKKRLCFVTEGLIDLAGIWDFVSRNVTSTLGAHMSILQKKQLNKFDSICLLANNDEAGEKMIKEVDGFYDGDIYVVKWEDEYNDINSIVREHNITGLNKLIDGMQLYMERLIDDYELF